MEAIIKVDCREHDIISLCEKKSIPIQTENLLVGDILLTGVETLVFERKTMSDLAASIKDGRYHEQKQRLKSAFPFHRITYIIEGTLSSLHSSTLHGIPSKSLLSSVLSTQYRDGFHLVYTKNVEETVWYLTEIFARLGEKVTFQSNNGEEYQATLGVKTKKKDNVTPHICYLLQLSQIPGISMKIANDIATVYPTLSSLILSIRDKTHALSSISGLGKKRIETIVTYLE